MVNISPKLLRGPWKAGLALDLQMVSSEFLGYNEFGYPIFDTKRSELGELFYRLKYRSDPTVVGEIAETVVNALQTRRWEVDVIVLVPPSQKRQVQPVLVLAEAIAKSLKVEYCPDGVVKIHETTQLKNITDSAERFKVLKDAFTVSPNPLFKGRILLFDDLYQSGTTLETIARILAKEGGSQQQLYVLTLTMARKGR